MKLLKALAVGAVSLSIIQFSACKKSTNESSHSNAITSVKLGQEWFPNSNYGGALFASKEFGPANDLNIKIVPGSDTADPVKAVLTGDIDFGDAAADKVLAAIANGERLVVIGVININSPTCFIARKEKHILSPKDFEGKRIGVLEGTATEYVYKTLVAKQQLDRSKLHEYNVPFELATFIADQYDVRPAFIYDEPVALDVQGIKYTIVRPEHYGVKFLGTVYFTTSAKIQKDPQTVQKFVNSVADGWRATIKYPEQAIKYLKEYDKTIDENRELLSLKKGREYFEGKNGKVLSSDLSDWEEMAESLRELNVIKSVDLQTAIDFSFVNAYHQTLESRSK